MNWADIERTEDYVCGHHARILADETVEFLQGLEQSDYIATVAWIKEVTAQAVGELPNDEKLFWRVRDGAVVPFVAPPFGRDGNI